MPRGIYARPSAVERFWSKVDKSGDCWLWTAGGNGNGYGQFWYEGRWQYAHRAAYKLLTGPIPKDLSLDHLCRVKNCVNPDHLDPVTHKENVLRGEGPCAINAKKTHCIRGHALTGDNLYVNPNNGDRRCRTCRREAEKRLKLKQENTYEDPQIF